MNRDYHVKKNTDIEKIIQAKISVGDSYFVVYRKENHDNPHMHFAISVPKKFGNAVKRNQAKRRVRDIISNHRFKNNFDFFVVVKPSANQLEYQEIADDLHKLFARAKLLEG